MLYQTRSYYFISLCAFFSQPNEDVTYASINHPTGQGLRTKKATNEYDGDNDCDYAMVRIPEEVQVDTHSESSKEECTDDYVLMG